MSPHRPELDQSAEDPDRVSVVLFTSGTTGIPKAVLHTFNSFYAGYSVIAANNSLTADEVFCNPIALSGGVGLTMGNMLPLYLGAQTVMLESWDVDTTLDAMVRHGVTYFAAGTVLLPGVRGRRRA